MLDDLLVCAVCHSELPLREIRASGEGVCPRCNRRYTCRNGVFDFTPLPPPHSDVFGKWSLWEKLQENSLIAYSEDPDHNLSVGEREDAKAFASFCQLSGLVLDIGCGPQELLSYVPVSPEQFVGIDPLLGAQPRRFSFVQGIGEYLPFRAATFDQVLFATSLDHLLSPKRALAEARRVVKREGTVNIWFYDGNAQKKDVASRWRCRLARLVAMLRQGDVAALSRWIAARVGISPTAPLKSHAKSAPPPAYFSRLQAPVGAVDYFHFSYSSLAEVRDSLREAGLVVVKSARFQRYHNFLCAKPEDKPEGLFRRLAVGNRAH